MRDAWRRQIFEAVSWKKIRGLAGAVCCELRDVEIQLPALGVLSIEGVLLDRRAIAPSDVENNF